MNKRGNKKYRNQEKGQSLSTDKLKTIWKNSTGSGSADTGIF